MTQPLPPVLQDPAILAGDQVKADYATQSQAVRGSFNITDVAKAEAIDALWTAANQRLTDLYADLQARRRARIDTLAALVPLGPDVPADASPADAAVLQQAFRAALDKARGATPDQKRAMLADAERFNDDTLRRGVITAAVEASDTHLVEAWASSHGISNELTELVELRQAVAGTGFWNNSVVMALGLIKQPQEVNDLPRLISARDAAIVATNQLKGVSQFASRAIPVAGSGIGFYPNNP